MVLKPDTCQSRPPSYEVGWDSFANRHAKRKYKVGGAPSMVAPNHLRRQFHVQESSRVWLTDITYIRTYEGWHYLAWCLICFRAR